MLRAAMSRHGGLIDTNRMAARVGAREAAVVAALRVLEAEGTVSLHTEKGQLWGNVPSHSPALPPTCDEIASGKQAHSDQPDGASVRQTRHTLVRILQETRAYREYYLSAPPEAIVAVAE